MRRNYSKRRDILAPPDFVRNNGACPPCAREGAERSEAGGSARKLTLGKQNPFVCSADTSPKNPADFQGRLLPLLSITGKGFTCYAFSAPICASSAFAERRAARAILLRLRAARVRACVMPIAAVRLRRMPELKKLPCARQFMSGARRNPCLQRGFDEATHERVAPSTERGGGLPA